MWSNHNKTDYPDLDEIPKHKHTKIIEIIDTLHENSLLGKNNKKIIFNGKICYERRWSFWSRIIYDILENWEIEIIKIFCKENHKNTNDYI